MSDRKLRVLSIAHTAVSRSAGRLRYHPLVERQDMDVHLVVPQYFKQFGRTLYADPVGDDGVTVHILPIRFAHAGAMSWYLHIYRGLAKLISEIKPDVIHLWEEPWSFVAVQACVLKKEAALVLEVDQNILKRLPPPFELIRRNVLSRCDHILSRSADATDVVRASGYSGPVSMIGYGVDRNVFHAGDPPATKGPDAPLVLGYVGRLIEEKGIQDALQAMAQARYPTELRLLGEGPYEQTIVAEVDRLGLGGRVSIKGWGEPDAVAEFMRQLDAMLLLTHTTPTVKEQFGRVIIEAQGCGIPVIGAQSGAIPDVIGAGGWTVPQRAPAALAALFDALGKDRQDIETKRRFALDNVEARFTYDAIADQLAGAWKNAASAKGIVTRPR